MNLAATTSSSRKSPERSSVKPPIHPSSFIIQPSAPPSLPDARPRSDRFRCAGRESKFLAASKLGATVELPSGPALDKYPAHAARAALLFGESQSRIILGVAPENAARVLATLAAAKIPHSRLGTVGDDKLSITAHGVTLVVPLADVSDPFEHSIERAMEG